MQGMLAELKQNTFTTPLVWRDILNIHKQQNAQKMHEKLSKMCIRDRYFTVGIIPEFWAKLLETALMYA